MGRSSRHMNRHQPGRGRLVPEECGHLLGREEDSMAAVDIVSPIRQQLNQENPDLLTPARQARGFPAVLVVLGADKKTAQRRKERRHTWSNSSSISPYWLLSLASPWAS